MNVLKCSIKLAYAPPIRKGTGLCKRLQEHATTSVYVRKASHVLAIVRRDPLTHFGAIQD